MLQVKSPKLLNLFNIFEMMNRVKPTPVRIHIATMITMIMTILESMLFLPFLDKLEDLFGLGELQVLADFPDAEDPPCQTHERECHKE